MSEYDFKSEVSSILSSELNVGNGLFSSKGAVSTPITSPKKLSSSRPPTVIKPKGATLREETRLRSLILASSPPGKKGVPRIVLTEPTPPLEESENDNDEIISTVRAATRFQVTGKIELELTCKVPRVVPKGLSSWSKLNSEELRQILGLSKHEYNVMGCLFASLLRADPELSMLNLSHPTARRSFVDSLNNLLRNNLLGEVSTEHQYLKKIQNADKASNETRVVGYTLYRFAIEVKKEFVAGAYDYLEGLYAIAEGQDRPARARQFLSPGFKKPYDARQHYRELADLQIPATPFVKTIIITQTLFRGIFFGISIIILFHISIFITAFVNKVYFLQIQIPDCQRNTIQDYFENDVPWGLILEVLDFVLEPISGYGLPSKFIVGGAGFLIGLYWQIICRHVGIFLIFCGV
ncbi:hypothetical protein TWF694_000247 [Orbilia ellipsospora]|uniref:Uncharacterized protein n=1 Tax=Orbilia ellipsospora TaxID=2528407 RepID=A0AAV9XPT0_9PEZI